VPRPSVLIDLGSGAGLPGIVPGAAAPPTSRSPCSSGWNAAPCSSTSASRSWACANAQVYRATRRGGGREAGRGCGDRPRGGRRWDRPRWPGGRAWSGPRRADTGHQGCGPPRMRWAQARPVLRRLGMREVAVVRAGDGKVDRARDSRADGRLAGSGTGARGPSGRERRRGGGFPQRAWDGQTKPGLAPGDGTAGRGGSAAIPGPWGWAGRWARFHVKHRYRSPFGAGAYPDGNEGDMRRRRRGPRCGPGGGTEAQANRGPAGRTAGGRQSRGPGRCR